MHFMARTRRKFAQKCLAIFCNWKKNFLRSFRDDWESLEHIYNWPIIWTKALIMALVHFILLLYVYRETFIVSSSWQFIVRPCVQLNKSNSAVRNLSWSRRTVFASRTWRNRIKYRKRRIPINQNRKLPLSTSDGHATSAHCLHTKTQTGYTTCQCMYSSRYDTFLLPCCVSISASRRCFAQ